MKRLVGVGSRLIVHSRVIAVAFVCLRAESERIGLVNAPQMVVVVVVVVVEWSRKDAY